MPQVRVQVSHEHLERTPGSIAVCELLVRGWVEGRFHARSSGVESGGVTAVTPLPHIYVSRAHVRVYVDMGIAVTGVTLCPYMRGIRGLAAFLSVTLVRPSL
jgi:hypothetical protein